MKKVTMYLANNGKTYHTEREALLDDAKHSLYEIVSEIKRMDSDSDTITEGLIENGFKVTELLTRILKLSK